MFSLRTQELNHATVARRVAKSQGVPPSPLTFSSRRIMENQVGTFYNLPCAVETLPPAQDEDGNFYETPGWSEEEGGDITRPTMDSTGWTWDSGLTTLDQQPI